MTVRRYTWSAHATLIEMTEHANILGAEGKRVVNFVFTNSVLTPYKILYEEVIFEEVDKLEQPPVL